MPKHNKIKRNCNVNTKCLKILIKNVFKNRVIDFFVFRYFDFNVDIVLLNTNKNTIIIDANVMNKYCCLRV